MRDLFRVVAFILFWCFILALFFVFHGTPDLWDRWHDRAMGKTKCTSEDCSDGR